MNFSLFGGWVCSREASLTVGWVDVGHQEKLPHLWAEARNADWPWRDAAPRADGTIISARLAMQPVLQNK